MEKSYYAYVRPKYANRPWNLEKLPLGCSILSVKDKTNIKSNSIIPFNKKLTDDLDISVKDGIINLLPGSYLINLSINVKTSAAADLVISVAKSGKSLKSIYSSSLADTPVTISGMITIDVDNTSLGDYSIMNNSSNPISIIDDSIISIIKVN